jgi:hypothetical protein
MRNELCAELDYLRTSLAKEIAALQKLTAMRGLPLPQPTGLAGFYLDKSPCR